MDTAQCHRLVEEQALSQSEVEHRLHRHRDPGAAVLDPRDRGEFCKCGVHGK
jgi:hypothetical protein